jgi:hypothetical protein
MDSISSLIFMSLLMALAVGAVATVLVAIVRATRDAIRAKRAHRRLLPDDWWGQFEREFRAYAGHRTRAARGTENRRPLGH